MKNVATIIMAGGQGSRLYPLTQVRSKPAVPIAGRFRLIDFPISNCIHSDLKRIFVLTQFSSESLHRHIFLTYRFDNFTRDFVTVLSAQQTIENKNWYQGTADAVRQNLSFIRRAGDLVLVLSGDHLYRMDYRKFIEFHLEKKADITISVQPVTRGQATQFGVMQVDGKAQITDFREKPKHEADLERMKAPPEVFEHLQMETKDKTHLASMGIYIFNWDVLFELLSDSDFEDFGREVIPLAIGSKKVFSYFFDGYWEDIGTIRSFFDAHIDLTKPLPRYNLYDEDRPIFTHARFLPGSKILKSEVCNSLLCEGSIINGACIEHSIIGIRSRIGTNTTLQNTIMMGANFFESQEKMARRAAEGIPPIGVGRDCQIRNAIIDRNARIGKGVKLTNPNGIKNVQTDNYCIVDGITVVPKNAVIPDGTTV